jgi:hypothetical protein
MKGIFSELKPGELFFCSGTEYVKVGPRGAIAVSPVVMRFEPDEQVAMSKQNVTTVGNWKWGRPGIKSVKEVMR